MSKIIAHDRQQYKQPQIVSVFTQQNKKGWKKRRRYFLHKNKLLRILLVVCAQSFLRQIELFSHLTENWMILEKNTEYSCSDSKFTCADLKDLYFYSQCHQFVLKQSSLLCKNYVNVTRLCRPQFVNVVCFLLREPELHNEHACVLSLALYLFVVQSAVVYPLLSSSSASP